MKKNKVEIPKPLKRKRRLLKLAIAVITIAVIVSVLSITGHVGTTANLQFANAVEPVEIRNLQLEKDELGYWTFTNEENTDFRLLQLTDIHIGNGFMSFKKDNMALSAVKKLIEHTQPDLIIITGDMVYPVPFQAGSRDNVKATELFATFMDSFQIPWAVTFGNHDEEWYSKYDLNEVAKVYESKEYCLFQRGPEDIQGKSNYFINILNYDGTLNTTLALIDSNSYYADAGITGIYEYDKIHDVQVEWYEEQIFAISDYYQVEDIANSLAFFHIPVHEYQEAWDAYNDGSEDIIYHYGKAGEKGEKVFHPIERGEMFNKIVELGSTKGIFCGHDHLNDFSITYEGVRLTYSKSIDYLAYFGIVNSTWQRGGTVITINPDGDFEPLPIKLIDIE